MLTDATDAVTIALETDPGGAATLSGTSTINAVAGLARFSELLIDQAGAGYTLVATSGSMPSATSAGFDVVFTWALVSTYMKHTCGLGTGGDAFCWGQNEFLLAPTGLLSDVDLGLIPECAHVRCRNPPQRRPEGAHGSAPCELASSPSGLRPE